MMVFINYFDKPPADEVIDAIRKAGGRAAGWEADLADVATVPELFDRAESAFGPVNVLVNNAAHAEGDTFLPRGHGQNRRGGPVPTVTAETHDRHFAVNSRAVALLIAEYARRHIARGAKWGQIISVSTDGAVGYKDEVSYCASKNALESYSRSAALELAKYGITVNIVSPGPIQTSWIPKEQESEIAVKIPLGRVGEPVDVADVVVFFCL